MTYTLRIPALLAAAGGAAWLAKLSVIAATGGEITATGAVAALYVLGVLLLAFGASVVTLRAARGRGRAAHAAAIVLAPVLFVVSFVVLETIAKAIVGDAGPSWLAEEAGILLTGAVWLGVGVAAFRDARRPA